MGSVRAPLCGVLGSDELVGLLLEELADEVEGDKGGAYANARSSTYRPGVIEVDRSGERAWESNSSYDGVGGSGN